VHVHGKGDIDAPQAPDTQRQAGPLVVQVVRTFPNATRLRETDALIVPPGAPGYRFAKHGDMSYYEALVQAIGRTESTIYLEEQYLVNVMKMGDRAPITDALSRTLGKSSFQKMVILAAGTGTIQGELYQAASRRAEFWRQLGPDAASKVAVYAYVDDPNSPWWFHSKTWIFDDTFAVVGSANCNRRSYSCDSEIGVAIADSGDPGELRFAKRLRMDLWLKHLNGERAASPASMSSYGDQDVEDFASGASLFDRASLLWRLDLPGDATPDIPLTQAEYVKNIAEKFGFVADLALHATISSLGRDGAWGLIDPDGA
jgi:phosphatidylserine/phosphatidylglycerophosphate/cardiolipin synthase-like enzyme